MPDRNHCAALAGFLIMAGLLAGCLNLGKGTPRPTRLYQLTALASDASRTDLGRETLTTIGIGPMSFPEYLNRPQILTRAGRSELQAAPFAIWAAPLKDNVMGVILDNVVQLTGSEAVYLFPWRADQAPSFQLQMAIDRFDAERNGEAVLVVRWEWLGGDGKPLMARRRSVLRQGVEGDSDDAVVAALSRLIEDYSRTVVARLNRILT